MGANASSEEASVHPLKSEEDLYIPTHAVDARRYGSFDVVTECIVVAITEDRAEPPPYVGKYYRSSDVDEQGREMWTCNYCWLRWECEVETWAISNEDGQTLYKCSHKSPAGVLTVPRRDTAGRPVCWIACDHGVDDITVTFQVGAVTNSDGIPMKRGVGSNSDKYFCEDGEVYECGSEAILGLAFRVVAARADPAKEMENSMLPGVPAMSSLNAMIPDVPAMSSLNAMLPDVPTVSSLNAMLPEVPAVSSLTAMLPDVPAVSRLTAMVPEVPAISKLNAMLPDVPAASGLFGGGDAKDTLQVMEFHGHEVERAKMTINHVVRTPWLVDNSKLKATTRGISYRTSKDIIDKDPAAIVEWGSVVNGVDMGDGWLVVGESSSWHNYLPFQVNGKDVLTPQTKPYDGKHRITGRFAGIRGELMLIGRGCSYKVTQDGQPLYDISIGADFKLFQLFPCGEGKSQDAVASIDARQLQDDSGTSYLRLQVNTDAGLDLAFVLTLCMATLRQLPAEDEHIKDEQFDEQGEQTPMVAPNAVHDGGDVLDDDEERKRRRNDLIAEQGVLDEALDRVAEFNAENYKDVDLDENVDADLELEATELTKAVRPHQTIAAKSMASASSTWDPTNWAASAND